MFHLFAFLILVVSVVSGSLLNNNLPKKDVYKMDGVKVTPEPDLARVGKTLHNGIIPGYTSLQSAAERALVSASGNMSILCKQQLFILSFGILGLQPWALQVLDAIGKPGAGLFRGSLYWMGQFDECLGIKFPKDTGIKGPAAYCYAKFPPPFTSALIPPGVEIRWDFCLPPTCDAHDLVYILQEIENFEHQEFPQYNISLNLTKTECVTPAPSSIAGDATAIAATIILLVIGILLVGGTALYIRDSLLSSQICPETSGVSCDVGSKPTFENTSTMTNRTDYQRLEGVDEKESDDRSTKESLEDLKESDCLLQRDRKPKLPPISSYVVGIVVKVFRAFSLPTNLGKLLSTDPTPGTIACLNGIRVMSMAYVILGHLYAAAFAFLKFINMSNVVDVLNELHHWPFQAIINADVSVDAFFFLSGLLVTYIFLQEMKKRNNKVSGSMVGWYYFHRWWRLTPLYGFVVMVVMAYFKYYRNGPLWPNDFSEASSCGDYWWRNLLYINNLFDNDPMCLSYTWYLANDMQFHIISPAILIPLAIKPVFGFIAIGALIAVHVFSTVGIMVHYGGGGPIPTRTTVGYSTYIYTKPYARIGVYCVGMIIGYILMKHKRIRMNKWKVLVGWCFALTCIPLVSYLSWSEMQPGAEPWSVAARCVWEPVRRHLWALALGWIVLACHNGYGGIIDRILSCRLWAPLSRLTYAAYLMHPIVIMTWSFMERNQFYYNVVNMVDESELCGHSGTCPAHSLSIYSQVFLFIPMLVLSYVFAGIVSLVFESPFIAIERLFMRGRHSVRNEKP